MNITETTTHKPKRTSKRELLFTFQTIIVAGLLALTTLAFFFLGNDWAKINGVKVIFAPFLSVVPLLFILSILKDLRKGFIDGDYTKEQIIKFSLTALGVTVTFTGITFLLAQINAVEVLLASVMALFSAVFFLRSKMKDMLGMSVVTGIAEGVIVYMIFLF